MDAVGLICFILFLIAMGMSAYYAALCIQAYPLDTLLYSHPDMGPLLSEDMNGNNEMDVRPEGYSVVDLEEPDSSKLKEKDFDEEEGAVKPLDEPPVNTSHYQTTPECAALSPTEDSVILPIEDEPSLSNASKPISDVITGPVVANLLANYDPSPVEPQLYPVIDNGDVPTKVLSVSYEEDGLLVPRDVSSTPKPNEDDTISPNSSTPVNTGATPKKPQFMVAPFNCSPVVDTNNLPYNKSQHNAKRHSVPVFHFSTPNSGSNENNEPLSSFCCKHKGDECSGSPCKKNKPSPVDETAPKLPPQDMNSSVNDGFVPENSNEVLEKEDLPHVGSEVVNDNDEKTTDINDVKNKPNDVSSVEEKGGLIPEINVVGTDRKESQIGWNVEEYNTEPSPDSLAVPVKESLHSGSDLSIPHSTGDSESSEPEVTEYSFISGPNLSSTASVLADEVGCHSDDKVNLTHFVPIQETKTTDDRNEADLNKENHENSMNNRANHDQPENHNRPGNIETHPAPHEELESSVNALSTPPNTPPDMKLKSNTLIIANPCAENAPSEDVPDSEPYTVLGPHHIRGRSSSSSSSSSESSSNGSYSFEPVKIDFHSEPVKKNVPFVPVSNVKK